MNYNIDANRCNIKNKEIKKQVNKILSLYLNETQKGNKVAFYYENTTNGSILSFNRNICFYAASTIKILVCLMILEQAEEKLLITQQDLKKDTGIIKYQKKDTYYSLRRLIELAITESDNTAYIKLVNFIGKEKIRKYGISLGAEHTMEGKKTDSFGIINCQDMIVYWEKIKEYSKELEYHLLNPKVKLIKDASIGNKEFVRKYGSWDIAYHEAGYINSDNPYYIIILTQLNKYEYKEDFINKSAKILTEINKLESTK